MSEIAHEKSKTGGRYVIQVDGHEAELTYSRMETSGNIIADHTAVPRAIGGRSIGKDLVNFMIADARQSGFKIMPLCPFVRREYSKHPEWSDVML